MPLSTITVQAINLVLDNVTDVVITAIQQDPDVGDYVRDVRFMGTGLDGETQYLIMQVKIRASVQTNIDITAPPQLF